MKRTRIHFFIIVCPLLLVALMVAAGCGGEKHKPSTPVVTVSIEPVRFMVEQIAGPRFAVSTLLPRGSNPETYEPSPRQLMALTDSKAYLMTGELGFEKTHLERLRRNTPKLATYNLSDSIAFVKTHDRQNDPHVWLSPRNAVRMGENICRALCYIDPDGASLYRHNLARFRQRMDSLDHAIHASLAHVPHRSFFILHPALAYFARDYGLKQICVNKDDKEPTPQQMQDLIRRGRSEEVRVFFVQKEFDDNAARPIAKATRSKLITINPLSYDYLGELDRITRNLTIQ